MFIEHYIAETRSRGGGASAAVCTRPQFRLSAATAQPAAMSVLQLTAREFGGHGAEPKPAVPKPAVPKHGQQRSTKPERAAT